MTKHLLLVRHGATIDMVSQESNIHERILSESGAEHSKLIGQKIIEELLIPENIFCSPALRAKQTLDALSLEHRKEDISYIKSLYNQDSLENIVSIFDTVSDSVEVVLIVGHLPKIQELGLLLCPQDSSSSYERLQNEFPPSSLLILSRDSDSWEFLPHTWQVHDFIYPNDIKLNI